MTKLALVLVSLLLLTFTDSIFAATGTAKCPDGSVVTCSGFRCVCIDGGGCTEYDQYDRIVRGNYCKSGTGGDGGGSGGDITPILD